MSKMGFIGCGNMASALIHGITCKSDVNFENILIHTRTKNKAEIFLSQGAVWCDSVAELTRKSDIVFICIKPQQADEVLPLMSNEMRDGTVAVSMLAGKSISFFKAFLGENAQIIRIMPNTPLLIGHGAVALSASSNVNLTKLDEIIKLIAPIGIVKVIPEGKMNTIVAVNGSSPAYFYLFVKLISEWAASHGVDEKTALELATKSMLGSAYMLMEGESPDELIKAVTSPGGTTLAALSSFDKDNLKLIFENALNACEKRSRELSEG